MKQILLLTMLLVLVTYAFACDMFAGIVSEYYNPAPDAQLNLKGVTLMNTLYNHSHDGNSNPSGFGYALLSNYSGFYVDHSDLAIYDPNNQVYADAMAMLDPANEMQTTFFLAHARYWTSGPTGGIHPFLWNSRSGDGKKYVLAHNGGITSNVAIENCMNANGFSNSWLNSAYYHCHNTNLTLPLTDNNSISDSELIFFFIMGMYERFGSMETGLNQALSALIHYPSISFTSLNIILSDGDTIWAYKNATDDDHKLFYSEYLMAGSTVDCFWISTLNNTSVGLIPLGNDCLIKYNKNDAAVNNHVIPITGFAATPKEKTSFVSGIDWRCFPVMASITQNTELASDYFNFTTTQQSYFSYISDLSGDYYWNGLSGLTLFRDKGYIMTTNTGFDFDMRGTLTPANYPVSLTATGTGYNWIGYFQKGSSVPLVALVGVLPYIDSIQSQDWFMYKENGQWYGAIQGGQNVTMNYGEMYKVHCTSGPRSFSYGYQPQRQSVKVLTTFYIPEETPEYQGVVIDSLSGITNIDEVALIKNGEVIGADKFVDFPLYIRAYTDDVSDLDVEILTKSKSAGNNIVKINNNKVFCSQISEHVYKIGNTAPILVNPSQNDAGFILYSSIYPNPFTSTANIRYTLSKSNEVNISIYNLKGQLVKTISNPQSKTGINSISWDGKDQSGEDTAAGIYFCKIKAGNKTLTSKVLRLK
ncbi:MAG TPA: T9SS type A sorting domain-containing protein [Candidatus Cloacimonadota bacterium]|nr:T9SS type A sorting domain-containing protein [Candidatus Cloacimonadota bacterium]